MKLKYCLSFEPNGVSTTILKTSEILFCPPKIPCLTRFLRLFLLSFSQETEFLLHCREGKRTCMLHVFSCVNFLCEFEGVVSETLCCFVSAMPVFCFLLWISGRTVSKRLVRTLTLEAHQTQRYTRQLNEPQWSAGNPKWTELLK